MANDFEIKALDRDSGANGHKHSADGSELTEGEAAGKGSGELGAKPRAPGGSPMEASPLWKYVSGALLLLLIASFFNKLRPISSVNEEKNPVKINPEGH